MEAKHSQRMHIEHFIYMDIFQRFWEIYGG